MPMPTTVSGSSIRGFRPATWHTLSACALVGIMLAGASGAGRVSAQDKSTADGVYTDAQAERGAALATASCEVCHGQKLAGADMGPGLLAADFKSGWAGHPVSELFEKISSTMPANDPGSLSPAKTADLVAYILKVNDYPAGTAELPGDMAALQQIKIAEKK